MTAIVEGFPSLAHASPLVADKAKDRLKHFFKRAYLDPAKSVLLEAFTKVAIDLVEQQLGLVRRARLTPAGWSLDIKWAESNEFNACAGRYLPFHNFEIVISMAAPAALFSLAYELESVRAGLPQPRKSRWEEFLQKVWRPRFLSRLSINYWLEGTIDEALLPFAAIHAEDAFMLLFFHELAHVIMGHCSLEADRSEIRRALEADADFNAGSMLALYLVSKNLKLEELKSRLFSASLLFGAVTKAVSIPSRKYHYPTIRAIMMIGGGAYALSKANLLPNFSGRDGNAYWETERQKHNPDFLDTLRGSSMQYFAGMESDLEADAEEFEKTTKPLRDKLKDGPLKSESILAFFPKK